MTKRQKKIVRASLISLSVILALAGITVGIYVSFQKKPISKHGFKLKSTTIDKSGAFEIYCASHDEHILSNFELLDQDSNPKASLAGPVKLEAGEEKYAEVKFDSIDITDTTSNMKLKFNVEGVEGSEVIDGITVEVSGPVAVSFESDPWSTVLYYANQGIDKLHQAYANDCENNTDFPGTLVGLERDVYLNGFNTPHKVKVVGEEQDFIENNPVSLTFQFDNLISGNDGTALCTKWDSNNNNNYWNSLLFKNLNYENDVDWYDSTGQLITDSKLSVHQMIISDSRNDGLIEEGAIKNVSRTVNVYNGSEWESVTQKTLLFCPTLINYFSETAIYEREKTQPEGIIALYYNEGFRYEYYVTKIGESTTGTEHECLNFTDLDGNNITQWVSSPWLRIGRYTQRTWAIIPGGSVSNAQYVTSFLSINPCFCI